MKSAIAPLIGKHRGETATVVGSGPSLLTLTASDFGPGPILTLNYAVIHVRRLGLPNPIYSLQKDDCLVKPQHPETVIHAISHSPRCWPDYQRRIVLNVKRDLGLRLTCMSSEMAVALSRIMGCSKVRMLGQDAWRGDYRRVTGEELTVGGPGYRWATDCAKRYAAKFGVPLEWV